MIKRRNNPLSKSVAYNPGSFSPIGTPEQTNSEGVETLLQRIDQRPAVYAQAGLNYQT